MSTDLGACVAIGRFDYEVLLGKQLGVSGQTQTAGHVQAQALVEQLLLTRQRLFVRRCKRTERTSVSSATSDHNDAV